MVFGLELRKMLYPSQFVVGGTGHPKFIPQVHRHNLEVQNFRIFVEAVQGYHGKVEDRKQQQQLGTTDKGKMTQLVMNQRCSGAKMGDLPVDKPDKMVVGGGDRREQDINVETELEASSDKPKSLTPTEEMADRQAESPTGSDSLTVGWTEAVCSYLDGFISDGLVVPQMTAGNGSFCLGVAPMEIGCSSYDGFSSDGHIVTPMELDRAGVSSGDSVMLQGKVDWVVMPISMGFFLAATLLRMMGAGLVDNGVYGVNKARSGNGVHLSQGVDDKCTRQIVVFENDQPDLGVSMEKGGASSEVACLGEEESFTNCKPLSFIAPPGLDLLTKMYKDNEVLGLGSRLDVSSWVKHRILGFSKVVELSVNLHERLCIDYLQSLERGMEVVIE
uniref:Uncharacterized protein n=1 Tax=Quercus lobata TaxID=97700 RepID=A0A7N2N123_QUELO